ncbi:hypothetical protein [Vulcaniibacterium gelatinicum]|uniref:hypothetical protein n=1 Tax=Vulcaniibacterium gelatinicum TaxID=2598725 RepID=UPI0011CA26F4|nr:hypothetical protein [Vulcaniibacterium gelatinicum]
MTVHDHFLLPALLALATTACGASAPAMHDDRPPYRPNPHPQQAYRVTVTVRDAPGPFAEVMADAGYQITDWTCLPPAETFSGVQTTPITEGLPLAPTRTPTGEHVAVFYVDGMAEADYFGHGVCRWMFNSVIFTFRATGAPGETTFIAHLPAKDLTHPAGVTHYYWKGGYPREDIDDFPDSGFTDPLRYKPELRDELFSITLKAEALTP